MAMHRILRRRLSALVALTCVCLPGCERSGIQTATPLAADIEFPEGGALTPSLRPSTEPSLLIVLGGDAQNVEGRSIATSLEDAITVTLEGRPVRVSVQARAPEECAAEHDEVFAIVSCDEVGALDPSVEACLERGYGNPSCCDGVETVDLGSVRAHVVSAGVAFGQRGGGGDMSMFDREVFGLRERFDATLVPYGWRGEEGMAQRAERMRAVVTEDLEVRAHVAANGLTVPTWDVSVLLEEDPLRFDVRAVKDPVLRRLSRRAFALAYADIEARRAEVEADIAEHYRCRGRYSDEVWKGDVIRRTVLRLRDAGYAVEHPGGVIDERHRFLPEACGSSPAH